MNGLTDYWADLRAFALESPLNALAAVAAAAALATLPIAFAVLARTPWFKARRGRILQTPSFAAVVSGLLLSMGIPAILLGLMVKSQYYDRNRYEFDPNRVSSVLDQGRQFELRTLRESLEKADEAIRAEQKRLAAERKSLVDAVKKLDQAMLSLGEAALRHRATSDALAPTVQALGGVRKAVGLDADARWQELVAILNDPQRRLGLIEAAAPVVAAAGVSAQPAGPAPLSLGPYEAELAAIPAAQVPLARLLPLDQVPAGWNVGDLGGRHIETFTADNLFEKINGRAESFLQYSVTGMAYAQFEPVEDPEAGDVQLYVYAFVDPLRALGKYGSERPAEAEPLGVGSDGYVDGTSVAFHLDRYFVQIVSSSSEPRFGEMARRLASLVAERIRPGAASAGPEPSSAPASTAAATEAADPVALMKLLPDGPNRDQPQYVAQDVFGYSFLADVFLASYRDDEASWQAFLRPYADGAAASAVFEKYLETAKADGATVELLEVEDADRMAACSNPEIGLYDVVFLKGNTLAGVNGSTARGPAEAFARRFARALPASLPSLPETSLAAPLPDDAY
ncbi:MAG: hypothetical protein KatS3mg108_2797 [Isosphaeraceae bacterium]|jgi:hypothetical protein|nr:MAG: hypothetical protein KatS3mg108_2797 [Isosphaeraceae bacterium]